MIDLHVHSERSGDAAGSITEICSAAVDRGLTHICFTDHLDFEPTDTCYQAFDYDLYLSQVADARLAFGTRLSIGFGVEVDYQAAHHRKIEEFLQAHKFDYVLGAVHYVDGVILENHERYFSGKTADQAYLPYFENALQAVRTGWFSALAHIDLCKRYGVRYLGRFDPKPYEAVIRSLLGELIDRQMALEINSSGLRQSPGEPYPADDILLWYRQMGGRMIVVGSDSHCAADVGRGIEVVSDMAQRAGFEIRGTAEVRSA